IIEALLDGPKNVSQLVDALVVSQSQISNQLACLKWCGFVSSQQEGKYVFYQITDDRIRTIIELARSMVADNAHHISCCTRM
ncbi:MAG: metalloregulator ArsR/SmtB family transcription factor, partial [Clostridia bacterium]|nr:metalloregulator ArsR/SmtB family transcription factor [Clostridia bacterium]